MATHLRDGHGGLTIDEYVKTHPEFRQKYLRRIKIKETNGVTCKICNNEFHNEVTLSHHVKKKHNMDKLDYVRKYIFDDEPKFCECGCGEEVTLLVSEPFRRNYVDHHQPVKTGYIFSEESKSKMREAAIKRGMTSDYKDTKIELHIKSILEQSGCRFEPQAQHEFGIIDFYLYDHDMYIEVDGVYWHPTTLKDLNHRQLSGVINDNRKNRNIPNLIRIMEKDVYNINSIDDILNYNTNNHINVSYKDIIIRKDYIELKADYINKNMWLYRKFIREFIDDYPYPFGDYNIQSITKSIYDKTINFKLEDKTFNNNTSVVGNEYLKSIFKSYWKSHYNNSKSPYEIYNSDEHVTEIIKNRLGLGSNDEVYDFSIRNINVGMSSLRHTISFFKPVVAARIYKHFIGDNTAPVVLDPCAGFGGRLLGFKSIYPNGTYIGLEPNIETYNELKLLSSNFDNVTILNSKLEDYSDTYNFDLTFTSIPYYDKEIYSNHIYYSSLEEWVDQFIVNGINKFNNKLINFSSNLRQYFPDGDEYFLQNNTSHFNNKSKHKSEYILKY